MTKTHKNQIHNCKKSSECMAKNAVHSLNNLFLSTIEEIDENNIKYSAHVTTKWKHLARTINDAYKIVLNEHSKYCNVSSNVSKILNGEQIDEEDNKTSEYQLDQQSLSKGSRPYDDKVHEKKQNFISFAEETSNFDSEPNKRKISPSASVFKTTNDGQQIHQLISAGNLSTEHFELWNNYKHLEITTNKLIEEYLEMHKKTVSNINNQNAHCGAHKDESLKNDVNNLIQQLNESINEFPDNIIPKEPKHDNFSNIEVQKCVLHQNKSADNAGIPAQVSSESFNIKMLSTDFSIKMPETKENAMRVMKEAMDDFHAYMKQIEHRIDRTKRDFDVLRMLLEGTILDCESTIVKAKKTKVKTIKSIYNLRMQKRMNNI